MSRHSENRTDAFKHFAGITVRIVDKINWLRTSANFQGTEKSCLFILTLNKS